MVRTTVQLVLKLLKVLRIVTAKSVHRVLFFWKGGLYTYIGIALFPLSDNADAITAFFGSPGWRSLVDLFVSIGTNVGRAGFDVVDALAKDLPTATGTEYVWVFWTVVVGVVTISWYFRTAHVVARLIEGGDVSPLLVLIFAVPLYLALVAVAVLSGEIEMAPIADIVESVRNLEYLFEWKRLVPGLGDVVNGTVGNETAVNESVVNATAD